MLGVSELVDNCNYLAALNNDDSASTEIIQRLRKYEDKEVRKQEGRLAGKEHITFARVFSEPTGYYLFTEFLKRTGGHVDRALFLKDVESYKKMRIAHARRKVAGLIFHRYVAQTPLPLVQYESSSSDDDDDDSRKKRKPKKKKKKRRRKKKDGKTEDEEKLSVFEAMKLRNLRKKSTLEQFNNRIPLSARSNPQTPKVPTPEPPASAREEDPSRPVTKTKSLTFAEPTKERKDDRSERKMHKRTYSFSMSEYNPDADLFEVGVENDLQMYGPSVDQLSEDMNAGAAPRELFNNVFMEVTQQLQLSFKKFLEAAEYRMYMRTKPLELEYCNFDDFEILRMLGRGGFGSVYAVRKVDSGKLYAMKVINKRLIKAKKAVAMTMLERHTLSLVHSRFVCGLAYAFQDKNSLFLVMDLMAGGDLKFHLTKAKSRVSSPRTQHSRAYDGDSGGSSHHRSHSRGGITIGFPVERARFHAAEILLGLEAMHSKNIIFRDLKLENVLLDNEGHCRLTDLGLVAIYGNRKVSHYAGTPGYIAPEVAQKKAYSTAVDIFSYGVTIYRMLSGKKPFKGQSRQDFDKAVCNDEPSFDSAVFDSDAVDLIKGLLQKDPKKRLGCGKGKRGFSAIKEHPWFAPIDWGLLEVGYLDPPFVPNRNDVNASTTQEINLDDMKQYEKVNLDQKFREQITNFEYVSKHAVRKELVAALRKQKAMELRKKQLAPKPTSCCVIS